MRKKDKEITNTAELHEILDKASVCRIAFSVDDIPYIVPMNFAHHDGTIFLHSSAEGRKMDMLKKNNNVCFELTAETDIVPSDKPCGYGMKYKSVIGFGKAEIIADSSKKAEGLRYIAEKYTGMGDHTFNENELQSVEIIAVPISSISGKKSGF